MRKNYYLKNVVTLAMDKDKCTGCRMCTKVCPHAVLAMNGKKAFIADRDACMECGACARNCAYGALSVKAGVGCAAAVIGSALAGKSEPTCGPECGPSAEVPTCGCS